MFTGLVQDLGQVVAVDRSADGVRLSVQSALAGELDPGDSVAVNGVCLTATKVADGAFAADVMAETLRRTALGSLRTGDPVNLERAVTPATRLGGHLVQGHVDGVGRVTRRTPAGEFDEVGIALPNALLPYVVDKGSIAIDGISLTIASVSGDQITIGLIPETLQRTTLGRRAVGDDVNVEVDVIAKYVERLIESRLEQR